MDMFTLMAPHIMRRLMADFGLTALDAAAVLGNLGHESDGFRTLQEMRPVVPGSRGGYGWAQWTGPRRKAFEAYCERNGLDPASEKANYGFLFVELSGPESRAINAVKSARTLADKVRAFEGAFLRAGIKHYPSRIAWARKAQDAFRAPAPPVDAPIAPEPITQATRGEPASPGILARLVAVLLKLFRG